MIVTKITDGFGNQLFMYACGYAAAKRLHTDLVIDTTQLDTNPVRKFELDKLNIVYKKKISVNNIPSLKLRKIAGKCIRLYLKLSTKIFADENPYEYNSKIEIMKDRSYLMGYWQSEKYFADFRNELEMLFQYNKTFSDAAQYYIKRCSEENSVAIHVRRGDYEDLGICVNEDYYRKAIDNINSRVKNPSYFVFTDDLKAAKDLMEKLGVLATCVEIKSDDQAIEEFMVMKECKNQIIANSSFSWWAAWLNKYKYKLVICPEFSKWTGDFYPEKWLKIQI